MAVSSEVDICNLALDYLNQKPITSIETPTTATEELCARWYDITRKEALRRHPWNFASKRAVLAPNATAPAFGFNQAYNLPADYIRIMYINDSIILRDSPIPFDNYVIEGGQILIGNITGTDTGDQLNLIYVSDFTTVTQMDPSFIDYLATLLAFKLAYKVTNSNTSVDRMRTLMQEAESKARAADGQESPVRRVERSRNRRFRRNVGTVSNYDGTLVFRR